MFTTVFVPHVYSDISQVDQVLRTLTEESTVYTSDATNSRIFEDFRITAKEETFDFQLQYSTGRMVEQSGYSSCCT